ncbi:type IV pilin protein [Geomesophilobacter sediminis]|uniref:Type II secretion system protein GspG C-terminal domain-containing protein n=1 Tax=Geomesophilobacter sediminis TaxID=2798584 RepID=A0A8J7S972_9BACT|nr:hypothetical protein [Geomesophilobacter sediminis]MBJ6726550.1 hypothetical protein [Geomesophilobacter sediminis]
MLETINNFLFKLFDDFSWKRLFTTVLAIVISIVGLLVFERYTSSFELNRIQKAAEILSNLQKIDTYHTPSSNEVESVKHQLLTDLTKCIKQKPLTIELPEIMLSGVWSTRIKNFVSGAAPWLILAVLSLPAALNRKPPNTTSFATFGVFAVVCGAAAIYLNLNVSAVTSFLIFSLAPLIVVAAIGIAAAIAIPQFAAYRMKAYDSSAIVCLKNAITIIESFFIDHTRYPESLSEAGLIKLPPSIILDYKLMTEDTYFVTATHQKSGRIYFKLSGADQIYSKDKDAKDGDLTETNMENPTI